MNLLNAEMCIEQASKAACDGFSQTRRLKMHHITKKLNKNKSVCSVYQVEQMAHTHPHSSPLTNSNPPLYTLDHPELPTMWLQPAI